MRMRRLRVMWSAAEDSFLLLCKVMLFPAIKVQTFQNQNFFNRWHQPMLPEAFEQWCPSVLFVTASTKHTLNPGTKRPGRVSVAWLT